MKIHNVFGVKVYDYEGNGRPLIFIHSFPLSSAMWDEQVKYFNNSFRVITYDIRGLGFSIVEDNVFTMEKLVNDFFHIINKLRLQKVNACGLSMGGYIILRAMQKDKERFESAILINTSAQKDNDNTILQRSNSIIKIKSGGRKEFINKLIPKLFGPVSENNLFLKNRVSELINWNSDDGICANLLSLSTRTDSYVELNNISIPILIIYGSNDKLTDKNNSLILHDKIKNSKLIEIKNAGHLCNMECKDEFNKALSDFLLY